MGGVLISCWYVRFWSNLWVPKKGHLRQEPAINLLTLLPPPQKKQTFYPLCLVKEQHQKKLGQNLTIKRPKIGAEPNLTALKNGYVHTYIYIYVVKLLSGPSFGFLKVIIWSKLGFLKVIIWSKFVFLAYKNSGFKRFVLHTQLSFCVFFVPNYLAIF